MDRRRCMAMTLAAMGGLVCSQSGLAWERRSDGTLGRRSPTVAAGPGGALKSELVSRMLAAGAYEVRIADPYFGFEHGVPGRNPLDLFPAARSVVSYAIPNPAYAGLDEVGQWTYTHPIVSAFIRSTLIVGRAFLLSQGYQVYSDSGAEPWPEQIQNKMCAYEAGIGTYGRSGLILHPELGSRIVLLAFFTNAFMPADSKALEQCIQCRKCENLCPGSCYDGINEYPDSFSIESCHENRELYKEQRRTDCQNCVDVCPLTKKTNEELEAWLENKNLERHDGELPLMCRGNDPADLSDDCTPWDPEISPFRDSPSAPPGECVFYRATDGPGPTPAPETIDAVLDGDYVGNDYLWLLKRW